MKTYVVKAVWVKLQGSETFVVRANSDLLAKLKVRRTGVSMFGRDMSKARYDIVAKLEDDETTCVHTTLSGGW